MDERTLQEIYFPAFKAAVREGGVGCVMTAYNLLNGTHCAESDYLMNQVLKRDWGFTGFVMSDWGAVHDGVKAANAGLDLEMPSRKFMNRNRLRPALADGTVTESAIDDKVRRILRTIVAAGFLDRPQLRDDIPRNDPQNAQTALEGAREAIVLLKNNRSLLPLDRHSIKTIAVIGPNAGRAVYCGGGSAFPRVFQAVSIPDGIQIIRGRDIKVLASTNFEQGIAMAKQADVAVVCAGFNQLLESEGHDRTFELPAGQSNFIRAVTAANRRTIVVISSGGGVAWDGWLDKTPAVLQAWYPGQSVGRAVAEIIFGDVHPSGRLPATFEKHFEDNPSAPYYHLRDNGKTPYTESIFVGYRGYDEKKIEPQFCFGFGLSYTEFKYGKATVTPEKIAADGQVTVSLEVRNSGKRTGDEVVQLYVHDVKSSVPNRQELKGFARVSLAPGEKKTVQIPLRANQLANYDVKTQAFVVEPGAYDLMIGASSRDIRAQARLEIAGVDLTPVRAGVNLDDRYDSKHRRQDRHRAQFPRGRRAVDQGDRQRGKKGDFAADAAGTRGWRVARGRGGRRLLGLSIQDGFAGRPGQPGHTGRNRRHPRGRGPKSALYVTGSELDYLDALQDGGFKVKNPNAATSCSCGESFSA